MAFHLIKKKFEYDAYTLVKAFYPQEEVENFYEEDAEEKKYMTCW